MNTPKKQTDPDTARMASTVLWTLIVMALGTVLGIWAKLFVINWVLADVVCR